ncbi:MAG: 2-hydroxyacid dehydrogenase [Proteobacteria bacterium]|nr:2-hydroxyacid dehydrogenase [Pseudomonadota bacterium]
MKVMIFDTKPYDRQYLDAENAHYGYTLKYIESKLTPDTARLAAGYDAVCAFVNDDLGAETQDVLESVGVRAVAMRCAGYNNVDIRHAFHKIHVVRVPKYSPYAIAEHALALLMTLNRKTHRAYQRTRDANFELNGLLGFDLHGKTVGIIGTGQIGRCFIDICRGLGMRIIASDPYPNPNVDYDYMSVEKLLPQADVVSLHCPLTADNYHLLDKAHIAMMKPGAIIINTSRGALIDTSALIDALRSGQIGGAALDVYEEEADYFFEDHSNEVIQDDQLALLLSFRNVIVTSHQAFFTHEALQKIAEVTFLNLQNIARFKKDNQLYLDNEVCYHCEHYGTDCQKKNGKNCF